MNFDAVIIGAGHNSLACAFHLAKKGWTVGVFEQAASPGGAVKTLELTEPGYAHDWAAMNLSLFTGSNFYRKYKDTIDSNSFSVTPATHCFATAFPDDKWIGVQTDLDATLAQIETFSKKDAQRWRDEVAQFPSSSEALFALLGGRMSKHAIASFFIKYILKNGIRKSLVLVRFLLSSPRQYLDDTFESPELKAMLAVWGMHLDFAPDISGGALFPYLEGMANQCFGMVLGKGGAKTLVSSLVKSIEDVGGEIHCNQRVAHVLHSGGKAIGIELEDGRKVTANKQVIANSAPSKLLEELLDGTSGDQDYDEDIAKFRHAPGTMMIHLAVEELPNWTASDELKKFAYVHLAPTMDHMAAAYTQAQAGLLPAEPVIVVGQPTAVDPSRAPDGKHILWIQVRMVPALIKGDAKGEIASRDWNEVAETYSNRVLDIIESYAPGLRKQIIKQRVVTPLELEKDNPNLVGGDQVCGSHHLSQNFLFRPVTNYSAGNTPIKGLHLIGAATWPGAGVGAGSGYLLAQKLAGQ